MKGLYTVASPIGVKSRDQIWKCHPYGHHESLQKATHMFPQLKSTFLGLCGKTDTRNIFLVLLKN